MMTTEEWEWLHLLRQLCRDGCTFSEAPISRRNGTRHPWPAPVTTTAALLACDRKFKRVKQRGKAR